jgi:hypothetical protein
MTFEVIENPDFVKKARKAGFSNAQFKKLDALFLQAASKKTLTQRSVECDFDQGVLSITITKQSSTPHV